MGAIDVGTESAELWRVGDPIRYRYGISRVVTSVDHWITQAVQSGTCTLQFRFQRPSGNGYENTIGRLFVCLEFYVVSTVFQLSNGDSSQILDYFKPVLDQSIILTMAGQS